MMIRTWNTIKRFFSLYRKYRISENAAALAYYALISLAPLLVLLLALGAFFVGDGLIKTEIVLQVKGAFGPQIASFIENFLESVTNAGSQATYSVIGIIILLYGATHLFAHIHTSLKTIFNIETSFSSATHRFLKHHTIAFMYIMLTFFVILLLSILNVIGSIFIDTLVVSLSSYSQFIALQLVSMLITVLVASIAFASMYRYTSQKQIQWKYAILGALSASFIIALLSTLFTVYIRLSVILSAYGASLFIVALLLWAYYAAVAVLVGALVSHMFQYRKVRV